MNFSIHLPFSASEFPQILDLALPQDHRREEMKNLRAKVYRAFQNSVSDFTQKR